MRGKAALLLGLLMLGVFAPTATAQQPDLVQEHWYHTYATLTVDVNAWADDHPDIVEGTTAFVEKRKPRWSPLSE